MHEPCNCPSRNLTLQASKPRQYTSGTFHRMPSCPSPLLLLLLLQLCHRIFTDHWQVPLTPPPPPRAGAALTSTSRLCTLTHSDASDVASEAPNISLLPGSSTSLVVVKSTAWLCMHCRKQRTRSTQHQHDTLHQCLRRLGQSAEQGCQMHQQHCLSRLAFSARHPHLLARTAFSHSQLTSSTVSPGTALLVSHRLIIPLLLVTSHPAWPSPPGSPCSALA